MEGHQRCSSIIQPTDTQGRNGEGFVVVGVGDGVGGVGGGGDGVGGDVYLWF